jgi:predicted ABC-type ATPase
VLPQLRQCGLDRGRIVSVLARDGAIPSGRIMLQEINRLVRQRQDFALETTLSDKVWARMIPEWQP